MDTEPSKRSQVLPIRQTKKWKLYIDGAFNSRGSGLSVELSAPQGQLMEQAVQLGFPAFNNVIEYKALLHSLRSAIGLGADPLHVYCDSQLVVDQISGESAAKDEKMSAYLIETRKLLQRFNSVQVDHISKDLNGHANSLASLASAAAPELRRIILVSVQDLKDGRCLIEP